MGVGGGKGNLEWDGGVLPSENPEATHFEVGLTLLADVGHCQAGARITHNEGVFG